MSSVYVLEPPTKGKVILKTSCGPLDIELWSKETPKACRNFVQLCMEGYYNGTIFHRIIKDFLVQGGDHTGTGHGGESIYGEPFADEIHTRLKFRHRGFVACANGGQNLNNSQFFVTLNRCDWIDGKNTIFGKVTGDTIYNLLKLAESDTDKQDRPLEPPKIFSVEILWNPFDDIVPRNHNKPADKPVAAQEAKTVKPKKRLNLLSFGEEAQQEEEEVSAVKTKIKSSHDLLDDPRLLKSQEAPVDHEQRQKELSAVRQALTGGKSSLKEAEESVPSDEEDTSFDVRMRQQLLEKKRRWDDMKGVKEGKVNVSKSKDTEEPQKEKESSVESKEDAAEDEEDESEAKKRRLVIKKKGIGSEAKAELALKNDTELQMLTAYEQRRQKVKQNNRNLKGREEDTMALLEKFKQKLSAAKTNTEPKVAPERENSDKYIAAPVEVLGWSTHKLKFEADTKDKMARNDDIDHYVVVDPLLEKGKEQFNKMQAKMKRRNREWAGKSYT